MAKVVERPAGWMPTLMGSIPSRELMPGCGLAFALAAGVLAVGGMAGWPVMLMALLAGLALGQAAPSLGSDAGVKLAATTVLRLGVVLLGARISAGQIAAIGWEPFATVLAAVPVTIFVGVLLARLFGQDLDLGLLSAGAVAICGASAALAVSTVLRPRNDATARLCGVVAVVTVLSSAAMIGYPIILDALGFGAQETGVVLGAAIHDVGQAVASGYSVSEETGDTATIVKLARVMLLPAVIVVLAMVLGKREGGSGVRLPGFILGFLALVAVNSIGLIPAGVVEALAQISTFCLVAAIAAIGMRTRLAAVATLGWKLPALILLDTLVLAGFVILLWL
ncbi:MAG: putative sulfate exporter family transporter [Pseudomonadota bacterium]